MQRNKNPILPRHIAGSIFNYCNYENKSLATHSDNIDIDGIHKNYMLARLLNHVIRGEQDLAEEIIKKQPELMFVKGTVKDFSKRTIKGSAFQYALGALDNGMWEMMEKYFDAIAPEENHALAQSKEQFPEDSKDENENLFDYAELKKLSQSQTKIAQGVFLKLNAGEMVSFSRDMLLESKELKLQNSFQKFFESKKTITKGFHFNFQNYINFLNDDLMRDNGFNNLHIQGFMQRLFPACFAQAFCTGLEKINRGDKLVRSLSLTINDGSLGPEQKPPALEKWFPLDSTKTFKLGENSWVNIKGKINNQRHSRNWTEQHHLQATIFYNNKRIKLNKFRIRLIGNPQPRKTPCNSCTIM